MDRSRISCLLLSIAVWLGPVAVSQVTPEAPREPTFPELASLLDDKARASSLAEKSRVLEELEAFVHQIDPRRALGVLADLEALDLELRLGRLPGVDRRLEKLGRDWGDWESVQDRVRALRAVLRIRKSLLIEPNAIFVLDVGSTFEKRFLTSPDGSRGEIPLSFPIRYLSELRATDSRGDMFRPEVVVGFVRARDLFEPESVCQNVREALRLAADPRTLLALFVYTDDAQPLALDMESAPWRDLALFWVRGSFERLDGLAVRTRYEWLPPGPTFFRVAPEGALRSWCLPWDRWESLGVAADKAPATDHRK